MKSLFLVFCAVFALACGGKNSGNPDGGGGDGDGGNGDGGGSGDGGPVIDGLPPEGCTGPVPENAQCSNCVDDDGDGRIDGFDLQCTGPSDNDEASFKTGLPGDNVDPKHQDCFFDGNSGAGNDGCDIHTCCLLGITDPAMCPYNPYDPMDCPPPIGTTPLDPMCTEVCGAGTPPGCDCFGCCTICDDQGNCKDILLGSSPNCVPEKLNDPAVCVPCTQVEGCGPTECGGTTCILCPGQDPDDLPDECNGNNMCPNGQQTCGPEMGCPEGSYCDNACCIPIIL